MALRLLLLMLLCCPQIARAGEWTHHGNTWVNRGKMAITVPASFKTVEDEHGVLSVSTNDGVYLTINSAHSKPMVKQALTGSDQVLKQMHVKMGPYKHGARHGVDVSYEEGDCSMHDVPIHVTLAVFSHGSEYLVCQLLVSQPAFAKYTPIMKTVFGSISSAKL
jgi:hypothetical protein